MSHFLLNNEKVSSWVDQLNKKETSDDSWASFVRKKRFLLHQKAVSTIANEIKKKAMNLWEKDQAGVGHKDLKQPSLRLIWGNGSFSHTGNHLPPVANIGLFRKLAPFFDEAILQDEPNTSKKSSCCHEDVVWFEKKSVSGFFFLIFLYVLYSLKINTPVFFFFLFLFLFCLSL